MFYRCIALILLILLRYSSLCDILRSSLSTAAFAGRNIVCIYVTAFGTLPLKQISILVGVVFLWRSEDHVLQRWFINALLADFLFALLGLHDHNRLFARALLDLLDLLPYDTGCSFCCRNVFPYGRHSLHNFSDNFLFLAVLCDDLLNDLFLYGCSFGFLLGLLGFWCFLNRLFCRFFFDRFFSLRYAGLREISRRTRMSSLRSRITARLIWALLIVHIAAVTVLRVKLDKRLSRRNSTEL